jgi:phosphate:Na+ symporter
MDSGLLGTLGGIGLFLFGMKILTETLRAMAGDRLRAAIAQATTTPLRGTLTGAAVTAIVQSSSAVTVMTVGFTGAGLMSVSQALGVIYGANIGTTATGWIVNFLGFKMQLGTIALPGMFVAALAVLLARGAVAQAGKGLAGLCLLFLGLDMMQGGAGMVQGWLGPDSLPGDSWGGRAVLVLIGVVVVSVTQSSSAAMALLLVVLGTGAVSFAQAAALLIGMNVGTTLTAVLSSVGGSRAMRQTALANLLFNAGTAVLAFPLLDLVAPLLHGTALGRDDQTALVLFHTGFNLMGAMVFLPLTARFAAALDRLVPERPVPHPPGLDPALLADPETALAAAHLAAEAIADQLFAATGAALAPAPDLRGLAAVQGQVPPALAALTDWLARIELPGDRPALRSRMADLLHLTDHLDRLADRLSRTTVLATLPHDPGLRRTGAAVGAAFRRPGLLAARFDRLADLIDRRSLRHRRATLLREHLGQVSVAGLFQRTDAMRWLAHVARHGERIAHYRQAVAAT